MHSNFEKYSTRRNIPWSPPRRKVTIGIGLICRDGIILASDSQTTRGAAKIVTQKINVVEFENLQVGVAQAGLADFSEGTIEKMRQKAKGKKVESPDTVSLCAQEAVRETYNHFWNLDRLDRLNQNDVWDYFQKREFSLLVGFYYDYKPQLFTVSLSTCYPVPVKTHFEAIGIGSELAAYLLGEYATAGLEFKDGYPISVYVVEKVIDNVEGCGRPTWVGVSFPTTEQELKNRRVAAQRVLRAPPRPIYESQTLILHRSEIDALISELKDGEIKAKQIHQNYIREVMENVTKKRLEKLATEYQSLGGLGDQPLED